MIRWTCIGCETPYAGKLFKPCPVCKPHRIEAKLKIAICKTNRCGNWVECGTTGRQGCELLAKPCQIESKIFKGGGCLAETPLFGPTEIVKEERPRIEVCCSDPENIDTSQITFAVTAFNRPDKLMMLLKSLWSRYPTAKVVIADTGNQYVDAQSICPSMDFVKYFKLPFDAGLSAARNAIVDQLDTPYMLLLEDDFVVDERCKIAPFLSVLNAHSDIGVVGGMHEMRYRGTAIGRPFLIKEDQIAPIAMPTHKTTDGVQFQISEFITNFALFRREFVQANKWDERLKVGEHLAYYRTVRDRNEWLVAYTPSSQIGHDRAGRDGEYLQYRERAKAWSIQAWEESIDSQPRLPAVDPLCVIVLTCGRSGSSLLASMLHSLGVRMANQFIPPGPSNPKGYYEDAAVHQIVREKDVDAEAFTRLVRVRNATQPQWGFKAPRFLGLWNQLKHASWPANTRVLATIRSEAETIASLQLVREHRAIKSMPKRHEQFSVVLDEMRSRGWPAREVPYHDVVEHPQEMIASIIEFLGIAPTQQQIDAAVAMVDPALRHIKLG
jgi:hypothetical protein